MGSPTPQTEDAQQFDFIDYLLFLDPEKRSTRELISELEAKKVFGPKVGKLHVFKIELRVENGDNLEFSQANGISIRQASKIIETAPDEDVKHLLISLKPMLASQGSKQIWKRAKDLAQQEEKNQQAEKREQLLTPIPPTPQEKTQGNSQTHSSMQPTARCIMDERIVVEEAQSRMRSAGFTDVNLVLDGSIHRVDLQSDKEKRTGKTGWYIGFSDGVPAVVYGDWRVGYSEKVSGADPNFVAEVLRLNPDAVARVSREKFEEAQRRIEESIKRKEIERAKAAEEAARTGWERYDVASPNLANAGYLRKKGVLPPDGVIPGLRCEEDGILLVPLYRTGRFVGIQTVTPNGEKRFLKGTKKKASSFFLEGQTDCERLFLCEGISTALSIWMATGASVLACFDCGNLPAVAEEIRAGNILEAGGKAPSIACDNDAYGDPGPDGKKRNSGVEAGMEASRILGCGMYIPSFRDVSEKPTDYNDLATQEGPDTVRAQLEAEPLSPDAVEKETEQPCVTGEIRVGNGKAFDAVMASPTARQKLVSEVKQLEQKHLDRMKGSSASPTDVVEECIHQLAAYAWTKLLDKEAILAECGAVLEASGAVNAMETVTALWQKYEASRYSEPIITLTEPDKVKLPAPLEPKTSASVPLPERESHAKKESKEEARARLYEEYGGNVVFVDEAELDRAASEALDLISRTHAPKRYPSYVEGGRSPLLYRVSARQLARLECVTDRDGQYTRTLVPCVLDKETLQYSLNSCGITWMRYSGRGKCPWVPCKTPKSVAEQIMSYPTLHEIPFLKGTLTVPLLGFRNGEVRSQEGYDDQTGWFSTWSRGWSPMDVDEAKDALEDAINEFPFASDLDRAVAIAAMLTAVIRPLLKTAPAVAVTASAPGTGKSSFCGLLSILNTGKILGTLDYKDDEAEFKKSLFAVLRGGGRPFCCIDNVPPLKSVNNSFLNQVLTGSTITERVLGASAMETVDTSRVFWAINGNGLNLPQDMVRRVILIRLQRDEERPYLHDFTRKDFEGWATENRERLVVAVISLLSAYIAEGRPKYDGWKPLGGYIPWSDLIAGCCVWLGFENPVEAVEILQQNDPAQDDAQSLFDAWGGAYGVGTPFPEITSARLMAECLPGETDDNLYAIETDPHRRLGAVLRDVLPLPKRVSVKLLAERLKLFNGKVLGGKKFCAKYDKHYHRWHFFLDTIPGEPQTETDNGGDDLVPF